MKKQKNKTTNHLITFTDGKDLEALVMAQLGLGNQLINEATGLSRGQITYRLSKAKKAEQKDNGYRVAWRTGKSQVMWQVLRDYRGVIAQEIERNVVPKIVHPELKFAKVKEPKAPTVDEAIVKLKRQNAGWL